jgi:hypothetical protein
MLDEKPGKQWLDCFLCESRKLLPAFPSGPLVTVIWSLALLQHRPPSDWMARCLTAVSSYLEASSAAAAAAAAGRLGNSSSSSRLLQKPQLPGMQAAAAAGLGSASCGYHPADYPNPNPQQQQQQQVVAPLSPQQVTRLAWSLATLDCQLPGQLMQQLMERAESLVGQLDSDSLAQLVWALDRLDDTPDKIWVRRFAATARAHLLSSHQGGFAAAGGFRPLAGTAGFSLPGFGVQQGLGLKSGQVVLVKPARPAAGLGQMGSVAAAAAAVDGEGRAAAAAGVTVQKKEIVDELKRVGFGPLRGASKQEVLAKLKQMRKAAE